VLVGSCYIYNKSTYTHKAASPAKMVQHQGIDVYLAPFGNIGGRYQEHTAPVGSPVYTGNPNDVWIEAVDGERFVIVVDLLNGFDPKGSKAIRTRCKVHGVSHESYHSYLRVNDGVPQGVGIQGHIARETEARKIDGRWVRCGYAFARLEIGMICS
jgi:hypothetical protein